MFDFAGANFRSFRHVVRRTLQQNKISCENHKQVHSVKLFPKVVAQIEKTNQRKMADVAKPAEDVSVDEPQAKKLKLDDETEAVTVAADTENGNGASKTEVPSATASDVSELERSIIDQIEYYFGDANLFRDKFLQGEVAKNDGWVPLSTMLKFKRLAALSEDAAVIVAALDKSDEGLVEISEDRQSIRRHPERPLPEKNEETRKEVISRTAYVKGFPLDLEMPALLEYFKTFPKVANIVIRKYLDKPTKTYKSKGSVFATFTTREQCAAFLSLEDVKYNDKELICKWQTDYYAGKKTEKQEKQKERNAKAEPVIELPKGAVLHLTGISGEITREIIKAAVEELGADVAFIDFQKGDESAHVRLSTENTAKPLLDKLTDGKLKLEGLEVPVKVLEGDEETEYLASCVEKIKLRRKTQHSGGRRHNQRRGGDNKRKQNDWIHHISHTKRSIFF